MYALYSKGFGKKAQDLNKKEFADGKSTYKLVTKATTADKTAFESNINDDKASGAGKGDVKFTIPVDGNFKVGVKAYDNKDTEVDAEFKFDENLLLRSTVKNLDPTFKDASMKITAGGDYVTKDLSVETAVSLWDKAGNAPKGASVALATNCPGLDWLRVGCQTGVNFDKSADLNMNLACCHSTKDYELAAQVGVGNILSGHKLTGGSLRGWFKASDTLQFAAEVDHVAQCEFGKDMYAKATTDGDKLGSGKIQLGTQWTINGSTTAKAKLTADRPGGANSATKPLVVDLAVVTALEGKSSATFSTKFTKGVPAFGLVYTLEA
jgi:hypothetical protein